MKPVFFVLTIFCLWSCSNDDDTSAILLEFTATEALEIINPEFTIEIYGIDNRFADVPATLIARQVEASNSIPFTSKIEIPKNPELLIEPLGNVGAVIYYVSIEWDADSNKKRCNGDISLDFTYGLNTIVIPALGKQQVPLAMINTIPCDEI
ncbi:hypothetical protein [Aquimarina sp. AU474]|uniref:hypothetical protein n=1 Tax=Aquimarina sp. AU474 TaxID=2108529 RepID=UPI000D69F328|nr:hypothetical protein [Aquimarina sp. AU474]